jgi:hypothetical protein
MTLREHDRPYDEEGCRKHEGLDDPDAYRRWWCTRDEDVEPHEPQCSRVVKEHRHGEQTQDEVDMAANSATCWPLIASDAYYSEERGHNLYWQDDEEGYRSRKRKESLPCSP